MNLVKQIQLFYTLIFLPADLLALAYTEIANTKQQAELLTPHTWVI